jgi:hypothetical protein
MKSLRSIIDEIYHLFIPKSKKEVWVSRPKNTIYKLGFLLILLMLFFLLAASALGLGWTF